MKECENCQYEKDAESMVKDCQHVWHNGTWDDMCCKCGLDIEMLVK